MGRFRRLLGDVFTSVALALPMLASAGTTAETETQQETPQSVVTKSARKNIERSALSQQSVIPMGSTFNLVGFNLINLTGKMPAIKDPNVHTPVVDFNSDDSFTRALKSVEKRARGMVESDQKLHALLQKESWNAQDREVWEKWLSQYVSEEFEDIPGLAKYRTDDMPGVRRPIKLNDLSKDIDARTESIEWDCKQTSVSEGIVIQKLENYFLPQEQIDPKNLKVAGQYFYAGGASAAVLTEGAGDFEGIIREFKKNSEGPNSSVGAHAFIVSGVTGNIIEGTANSKDGLISYLKTTRSFEDFVAGHSLITSDRRISLGRRERALFYGSWNSDPETVQQRKLLIEQKDFLGLKDVQFKPASNNSRTRVEFLKEYWTYTVQRFEDALEEVRGLGIFSKEELQSLDSKLESVRSGNIDNSKIYGPGLRK